MAKTATRKSTKKKKRKMKTKTMHRVAVLHTGSPASFDILLEHMQSAARTHFQIHGSNDSVRFYPHYADDDVGLLEDLAEELVNETDFPVIVAAGGPQSAIAAMDATAEADLKARKTVPIVFTTVADPKGLGLVDDVDRPGRHLTGMAGKTSENDPVRLKHLHAFVAPQRPSGINKVGVLINPGRQGYRKQHKPLRDEARRLGLKLVRRRANNQRGIERAFRDFRNASFLGVVVTADSFFNNKRAIVIGEAARDSGVPAIYQWRTFVEDGGLISFGPSIQQAYEETGRYVARILLGERPAQMACSRPTGFELVVKQATATSLGLAVPDFIGGTSVVKI